MSTNDVTNQDYFGNSVNEDIDNHSDSDSDDEEECIGNKEEHVRVNDKVLIEKFCDVADNMFEKAKEKRKKNLLLKGLMKIEEFNADKSLDSPNDDGFEEYKNKTSELKVNNLCRIKLGKNLYITSKITKLEDDLYVFENIMEDLQKNFDMIKKDWNKSYQIKEAFFPDNIEKQYFPSRNRINEVYGDRNLVTKYDT